ncbi:SNF2-related domain-containing protein [Planoprotostelium fungivorum]|uniref:SNF2-related domain-containing protein n=1 Tax=Planoprotostelium fungivorum TaxID=1890364 RepID=A0A2P6N0X0_9EUKA|nr:SNF2-related domain-containing protein [Planoprotostelium fungivorum]
MNQRPYHERPAGHSMMSNVADFKTHTVSQHNLSVRWVVLSRRFQTASRRRDVQLQRKNYVIIKAPWVELENGVEDNRHRRRRNHLYLVRYIENVNARDNLPRTTLLPMENPPSSEAPQPTAAPAASNEEVKLEDDDKRPTRRRRAPTKYDTYVSEGEDDEEEADDSDDDPSYGAKVKNDSDEEVIGGFSGGEDDDSGKKGRGKFANNKKLPKASIQAAASAQMTRPNVAYPPHAQIPRLNPAGAYNSHGGSINHPTSQGMPDYAYLQQRLQQQQQQAPVAEGYPPNAAGYPNMTSPQSYMNMISRQPQPQPQPQIQPQQAQNITRWTQQRQALMEQLRKQQQTLEGQNFALQQDGSRLMQMEDYLERERMNPSVDPAYMENEIYMLKSSIQNKQSTVQVHHLQLEILQQQLCMMNKGINGLVESIPTTSYSTTPYLKRPLYGQDPNTYAQQQQQGYPYMKQGGSMSHKVLNEQNLQFSRDAAEARPLTEAEQQQRARLQNLALFDNDFRNQSQRLSSIGSYSPMNMPGRPGFPQRPGQPVMTPQMMLAQQKLMMMKKKGLGGSDEEEEGEFSEEEEEETELIENDPARKELLQITHQCENYANKMRKVLSQWQAKSKGRKLEGGDNSQAAETNNYAVLQPFKPQSQSQPAAPAASSTPTPSTTAITPAAVENPPSEGSAESQPTDKPAEPSADSQDPAPATADAPAPTTDASAAPTDPAAPVNPDAPTETPTQPPPTTGQTPEGVPANENPAPAEEKSEQDLPDIDLITQPENLQYELRPYQLIGLNWLYLLFQQKINGILADEMGLGKTIQTIALFSLLAQRGEATKPHVVIAPSTALENWVREFKIWCPSLRVVMYHGTQKDREILRKQLVSKDSSKGSNFDVLITTYNICINKTDRVKLFKKVKFSFIVLDEAHNVKNVGSVRYKNLLKLAFRAEYRLMLTGTPLQNNINELWTLLSFLMPGIFSKNKDFTTLVWEEEKQAEQEAGEAGTTSKPSGKDIRSMNDKLRTQNSKIVDKLKTILAPFVLRRMKADVLGKLPAKTEKVKWCDLTPSQHELYQKIHQYSKSKYHEIQSESGAVKEEEKKPEAGDVPPAGNTETSAPMDVEGGIKKEEAEVKTEKKPNRRPKDVLAEDADEKVDGEKPTLNHLIMQLRKAANNTLLFRNIYTDEKLKEIQAIVESEKTRETEAAQKAQETAEAERLAFAQDEERRAAEAAANNAEKGEDKEPLPPQMLKPYSIDDDCGICGQAGELVMCDGGCGRAFHQICCGIPADYKIPETEQFVCEECRNGGIQGVNPNKQACEEILDAMENITDDDGRLRCELFVWLPSREEYPQYFDIIKEPISLNMIRRKPWPTAEAFRDALHLMFKNARTFNNARSEVFKDAVELEKCFVAEFSKRFPEIRAERATPRKPANKRKVDTGENPTTPAKRGRRKAKADDDDEAEPAPTPKPKTPASASRGRSKKAKKEEDEEVDMDMFDDEDIPKKRKSSTRKGLYDDTPRRSSRRKPKGSGSLVDYDDVEGEDDNFIDTRRLSTAAKERLEKSSKVKLAEPFATCQEVLEDLLDQKDAETFEEPVNYDELGLEDYLSIIKEPMDLGTVHNKLLEEKYSDVKEFVGDIRKVFDNCLMYNEPSSSIGIAAQSLWSYFKGQCRKQKISVEDPAKLGSARNVALTVFQELEDKTDYQIGAFCQQHPYLKDYELTDDQIMMSSGKMIQMRKILEKCHKHNDRIIIFSQFTAMLDVLEEFMRRMGFRFLRLDGQTPVLERQEIIDEYNRDPGIFVFLLSTRAGGIGINLTAANVCIFHDIDWNPEMDRQAEARIHRIGQMRPVKIIKLLSKQSVDKYIFEMSTDKKARNDVVMGNPTDALPGEQKQFSIGNALAEIFQS